MAAFLATRLAAQVLGRARVAAPSLRLPAARGFAAAGGVPAEEVTERVIAVVKNFEKVDGSKVRGQTLARPRPPPGPTTTQP